MKTHISISAAGLAFSAALLAQTPQSDALRQAMDQNEIRMEQVRVGIGGAVMTLSWETPMLSGHPYSATARTVMLSPDGAHVDSSRSEKIYRDDLGRTRREINGGKNIAIIDPVAGIAYDLNAETKTAIKRTLTPAAFADRTKVSGQSLLELVTFQSRNRQNIAVKDLGTQAVSGVAASGVRTTSTVSAGAVGNDRDLVTTIDRWVSNDLRVMLKSVVTEPQSGTTTYELTDLALGSPDASLFQVPDGYTVKEPAGRGGVLAVSGKQ
jgi:hypothetical protein